MDKVTKEKEKKLLVEALKELLSNLITLVLNVLVVVILWNLLVPGLFPDIHPLTFWQGVGIYLLCRLLFTRSDI
jgi:hypothetical protein